MTALRELTVDHSANPVGTGARPVFGWQITSDQPDTRQRSRRIEVRDLAGSVVWDSGVVTDDHSVDIGYGGAPLRPLARYRWSIEVETTAGRAESAGTFVTGVVDADWRGASWIGASQPTPAAPIVRGAFEVDAAPDEAYLVIAAGGLAHVELDGRPVDDSVLGPGFTDYDVVTQYTVADVTAQLAAGTHVLTAELGRGFYGMLGRNTWNWETAPWHDDPCVRLLLVIRGADGEQVVVTDDTWRAVDGATTSDDLYAGEDFDARRRVVGAGSAGTDVSDWPRVRVATGPAGAPEPQRQPPIVVAGHLEPESVVELGEGRWVVGFERVVAGWVEIEADGAAGDVIELRFGETLEPDGTPNHEDEKGYFDGRFQTDRIILDDTRETGPLRWHPRFTWHGFRYVEVRAPRLPRLRAAIVHTRAPRIGRFSCSDPLLNTIHELTVRTILSNLHGIPTDTPKYEKNGWTGDGMVGARMMLQNLDTHELLAKWSADIAHSRHGAGAPQVIAPHGGWRMDWSPAPTWHSALLLVPWEVHLQRGDRDVLAAVWPDARDYLRFEIDRSPGGIAETTLGDWVAPDTDAGGGNPPEDARVAATAFLIAMCDTAARIAAELGEPADEWLAAAQRSREAFVATFWDADRAEVRAAGDDGYRQAHAVLALAFDVLPEDARQPAADRLAADVRDRDDHLWTGALATKHILPVLTRFGHADAAVAVATQTTFPSWGHWVELGATSLWEHWKPESRSRGHYFLGTIDDWLYGDVAGLRPLAPGWRRARIEPGVTATALSEAEGAVRTPYGDLSVRWRRGGAGLAPDELELTCEVPVGVTAEVVLPGVRREVGSGVHTLRAHA
ncbi:alpha-L-rhamnosidase [Microbacterium paludicola]|uniref:alpha-L-rhamnosidase n=1 Tax=Microbacterium paludicola TaxID=300019 RepID=A0ABU1I1R6_9MICO|nr:family 78 glycoside hydrolase catalytic domain [Microbacterium paludicola]MDR6167826.1 alpha-L-rhamnosidase [Microbacterium paludicola]